MNIIKSFPMLTAMAEQGLITLHAHTGSLVFSPFGQVKAYYIDGATNSRFEYGGKKFKETYVSGSFYPYIEQLN